MSGDPVTLPPLDPNASDDADGDQQRKVAFLRKKLAEATPSRACHLRYLLDQAEGRLQLERE